MSIFFTINQFDCKPLYNIRHSCDVVTTTARLFVLALVYLSIFPLFFSIRNSINMFTTVFKTIFLSRVMDVFVVELRRAREFRMHIENTLKGIVEVNIVRDILLLKQITRNTSEMTAHIYLRIF